MHVDLVGPLSVSEDGFAFLMMMIDRTMRSVKAVHPKNIAAASCVEAFMSMSFQFPGLSSTAS
jgi:hypothetical protein